MSIFSPLAGLFSKLGQGIGGAVKKPLNALGIEDGTMARTPSFVPKEVGQEVGAKMGGTFPREAVATGGIGIRPNVSPAPAVEMALPKEMPTINPQPMASTYDIANPNRKLEAIRQQGRQDPMARAKYDYITKDQTVADPGEAHRGFKAGVKDFFTAGAMAQREMPSNASLGERLGALLGGGTAGAIVGKKDPVGFEEQKFEMFQMPRLYRDQQIQYEQQKHEADLAKAQQDALYRQQQGQIMREEQNRKNSLGQPVGANGIYVDGKVIGQKPPAPQRPIESGGVVWEFDPQTNSYNPRTDMKATSVITGELGQRGQDTRLDKTIKSRETIAKTGQAISLAKMNKEGSAGSQRQEAADRAFAALQDAYGRGLPPDSPEVKKALTMLRNYPDLYETGMGVGDFPYAKPRGAQAGGARQPKPEIDVEAYVADAEKAGKTREQALQFLRGKGLIQ